MMHEGIQLSNQPQSYFVAVMHACRHTVSYRSQQCSQCQNQGGVQGTSFGGNYIFTTIQTSLNFTEQADHMTAVKVANAHLLLN